MRFSNTILRWWDSQSIRFSDSKILQKDSWVIILPALGVWFMTKIHLRLSPTQYSLYNAESWPETPFIHSYNKSRSYRKHFPTVSKPRLSVSNFIRDACKSSLRQVHQMNGSYLNKVLMNGGHVVDGDGIVRQRFHVMAECWTGISFTCI